MKNKFVRFASILALTFSLSFHSTDIQAQCPMCKMSAESNLKNGGTSGKGLNFGILYMFSMPYILVATMGFIWYRNRREEDEIIPELEHFSEN